VSECGGKPACWPPYPDDRPTPGAVDSDAGAGWHRTSGQRSSPGQRSVPWLRSSVTAYGRDPRCPSGAAAALAYFGPLIVCGVLAPFGASVPLPAAVAVLATLVAGVGWVARAGAGLLAVGSSWLCLNGFRENSAGTLALHPRVDGPAAAVLAVAWLLVFSIRVVSLRRTVAATGMDLPSPPAAAVPGMLAVPRPRRGTGRR
jgi:hypothetical protein